MKRNPRGFTKILQLQPQHVDQKFGQFKHPLRQRECLRSVRMIIE